MWSSKSDTVQMSSGYWTCPYCDEEKRIIHVRPLIENLAISSLAQHIRGLEDDAHGEKSKLPAEFDVSRSSDYIVFNMDASPKPNATAQPVSSD